MYRSVSSFAYCLFRGFTSLPQNYYILIINILQRYVANVLQIINKQIE
jgi:hypothetical protein